MSDFQKRTPRPAMREQELVETIIALVKDDELEAARPLAEELAELLGPEENNNRFTWSLIWEARGRLDEAIAVAQRDIEHRLSEIEESASQSEGEPWFIEEISDLLDAYYLQASRYLEMEILDAARAMMLDARKVSLRYHVPFDEALQERFDELCGEEGETSG